MFKGFYTASTGMMAQQRRTEMLSNNVANANTAGYKAEQSTIRSFPNMLMSSVQKNSGSAAVSNGFNAVTSQKIGDLSTGVYVSETLPNFKQGSIIESGVNTDIALLDGDLPMNEDTGKQGSIFFKLQAENGGQAYTRNGNFTLDGEGYLTTASGNYVLDENDNRLQFTNEDFNIAQDGTIKVDNQEVGRLGVAFSNEPDALVKQDNGLFYTQDGTELENAYTADNVSFTMEQGFTESSNVDASQAMTEMMSAYRIFEANQKILTAYDRSMDKAVNEIGKV